jgi:hypothetical protein
VFSKLPPVAEQSEGKYPDGYPYLINPVEEVIDLAQADISNH